MKKLRTGGLIAIICVVGMGIVLGARSVRSDVARLNRDTARAGDAATTMASATPDAATALQTAAVPAQTAAVPDKVVYGIFFRQIAAFKAKADEMEKSGGDGKALRRQAARTAGLNDTEAQLLDRVAADYLREVSLIDARQKAVVDAFRLQYPDGRIPQGGARERPPAFHDFTVEREQLYLRMRDQLQNLLGPETFARLDTALRGKIAGNPLSILGAPPPSATQEAQP